MSKLTEFLIENPVDDLTEKVNLGGRLKNFEFTIKGMTGTQFNEYQKAATKISKGKKVSFDSATFNEKVIINSTIEPNFKDAEFVKKLGVQTPEQAMYKVLLSGEIAELAKRISQLSGFDVEIEEEIEEAKNS